MVRSIKSLPTRKRTLRRKVTDSSASCDRIPKSVSASSSSTRSISRRKIHKPEYLSDHHIHSEDETDEEEEITSNSVLVNDEVKSFSSSKWSTVDLSHFSVEYEKKSVSLEVMLEQLKEKFTEFLSPSKIDPTEVIEEAKEFLKENLPFSINLRQMVYSSDLKKKQMMHSCLEEISKTQQKLTSTDLSTLSKFHQIVGLVPYMDFTTALGDLVLMCTKGRSVSRICSEKMLQDICEKFMELFFLRKSNVKLQTYHYKKKTVRTFPDIIYPHKYAIRVLPSKLFFVTEVKSKQMPCLYEGKTERDEPMERKVSIDVMGQIGSELLQGKDSIFHPNSLAVVCMETKLIFVYLRRSIEHYNSMMSKEKPCPIPEKAVITHTEPYDMLIVEDRMKMADLLFWLGCVQDRLRYKYI